MSMDPAREHCARGASVWDWASTDQENRPDVVIACAGDIPTLEALGATALLREHVPQLRVRFVNVVDLLALTPAPVNAHSLSTETFAALFTEDVDVVMAFHGYARAFHQIVHGRPNPARFHVRGYNEHGTTTTPFDMVVLNEMSRFHLVLEALQRARRRPQAAEQLEDYCRHMLVREHLDTAAAFAPLHVPPALALVDAARPLVRCPQIVCVDTAFHADLPASAATYAIPAEWRELGIQRYGFHGLSYAWGGPAC